jgi:hypothetical protein
MSQPTRRQQDPSTPTPPSWHRIRAGGRLILAADFPATGRPEAGFADLAPNIRTDHGIWETRLPAGDAASWSMSTLIGCWAEDIRAVGLPVDFVMGYCASSAYALVLAREVHRDRASVPVVLFDPTVVTRHLLYEFGFMRVVEMFRGVLDADEFEATLKKAAMAADRAAGLGALAAELDAIYRATAKVAFAQVALIPEQAEELSEFVTAHLHHLRVAGETRIGRILGEVTAIRSADYPGSMEVGTTIRCPAAHSAILADDWTGNTVTSLIEGRLR